MSEKGDLLSTEQTEKREPRTENKAENSEDDEEEEEEEEEKGKLKYKLLYRQQTIFRFCPLLAPCHFQVETPQNAVYCSL